MEKDPVSKTLCLSEYRTMENIKKKTVIPNDIAFCSGIDLSSVTVKMHTKAGLNMADLMQTKKLHGFSPQANHTDRATAAFRRS
jgi:hypothetical protein